MTWPFSWHKPISIYDTDGPPLADGETYVETFRGIEFALTRSGVGIDTGRDRYRVQCLTCGVEVHRSTTGPSTRIRHHLDEVHGLFL